MGYPQSILLKLTLPLSASCYSARSLGCEERMVIEAKIGR